MTLRTYLQSIQENLESNLDGVAKMEEEPIHEFRVAIKKLRSVLNLLNFSSYREVNKRVILRPLRSIFRKTGKIRELHIHQSMIPEYAAITDTDPSFLDKKIQYQLNRNQPYLGKLVQQFRIQLPETMAEIHAQIDKLSDIRIRKEPSRNFQIKLEKRIQKELKSEVPNLHRIRRMLKQKVYIFDTFQESELLGFFKEYREEWKILETSLGTWHDQLMFKEWLIRGLKWKRLKDDQYKVMMRLIAHLRTGTNRMEKELIKAMLRNIPKTS